MTLLDPFPVQVTLPPAPDWRVVGPWYRWERTDGAEPERALTAHRPALHKFGSTEYVADFLKDPQRSLVFDPKLDVHHDITVVDNPPIAADGNRRKLLTGKTKVPSETRKLFLPAHQRFYLVSAGLHCTVPGFPRVAPESVTEMGFVVRRVRTLVDDEAQAAAAQLLRNITVARAQAQTQLAFINAGDRAKSLHPFRSPSRKRVKSGPAAALRAFQDVERAKRELHTWATVTGVDTDTDGWVGTDEGTFGSWLPMTDTPDDIIERSYSMRLLTPNPDDPHHAAHDGPIYWAAIPTASDEVTPDGSARFNENDLYHIRVFARPMLGDCPGPLVWSEPSESFRIASFFDPDGCSLRPTEIRLPDFAQLEATDAKPSVKMTAPPGSSLTATASDATLEDQTEAEICFWFIPLITIVAMFVLNIFLPIVVFIFQLWWMLKLKFCIPPSGNFESQLAGELGITPAEFEFEADFDVHVDALNEENIRDLLEQVFAQDGKYYQDPQDQPTLSPPPFDPEYDFGDTLVDEFSIDALMKLAVGQGYGRAQSGGGPIFPTDPDYTSAVLFEEVEHP